MEPLGLCSECGVPEIITSEHAWLDNGDIVQARNQSSRMVFIETENMDPLFAGIAQIVGVPIERIVITAGRRAYRGYLKPFVSSEVLGKITARELDYEPIDGAFRHIGRINGVGRYEAVERRYEQDEHDYDTVSISEPYSVPLTVSAHVGAIELLTSTEQGYNFKEISPDFYHVTAFPSEHPGELKKRMIFRSHTHAPGDLQLERCATCGGPRELASFKWLHERGVIVNRVTGRRMAIQGDAMLDPVFRELEEELGDMVPRAVVEAQRRFTTSGFFNAEDLTDEAGFRNRLALRGLGNIRDLSMRRKGLRMRVAGVALPMIVMGLAQGFYEMGFGLDATGIDWELDDEGSLEVEVKPL